MIPQEWLKFAPRPKALSKDQAWNVFLSYRSVDRAWALNLYDILKELGYKVFLDQFVLKAGDELITKLQDGLSGSQCGVLLWSKNTGDSDWVRKEYNTLERKSTGNTNFIFVPVKLDGSELPEFAKNKIFVDFSSYPDGPNGGDLLRLLHAIDGKPLSDEAVHFANDQDEEAREAAAQINAAIRNGRPERLLQLFQNGGLAWKTSALLGCKAAEGLTKLGNNDEAIKMLEDVEKNFPRAVRPKQLRALALARRGTGDDVDNAQDILGVLYEKGERDPETLGIYARTWNDRYNKTKDLSALKQSRDLYAESFDKFPDDYYTGINAVSKSVFLGTEKDLQMAAAYAEKVQELVGTEAIPGDYWKTATIGEVLLIQKKYQEAADMYNKAVAMARLQSGSIKSTFDQAKNLLEKLQPADEEKQMILDAFN